MRRHILTGFFICAATPAAAIDWSIPEDAYMRVPYGFTMPDAEVTETIGTTTGVAEVELSNGSAFGAAFGAPVLESWGDFLLEGEVTRRSSEIERSILTVDGGAPIIVTGTSGETVDTWSMLSNMWYRAPLTERLKPYAGGGLGLSYFPSGALSSDGYSAFTYQAGAGVDYETDAGVTLGLGYRYLSTSNSESNSDSLFDSESQTDTSEQTVMFSVAVPFTVMGDASRRVARRFGFEDETQVAEDKAEPKGVTVAATTKAPETEEKGFFAKLSPFGGDKAAEEKPAKEKKERRRLVRWVPGMGGGSKPIPVDATQPLTTATLTAPPAIAPRVKPTQTASVEEAANTAMTRRLRMTEPVKASAPAPVPAPAPKPAAAPAAPKKVAALGQSWVQLGAFSDAAIARDVWNLKMQQHRNALFGYEPVYQKVKTAEFGSIYRLRVGPMDKGEAKALCATVAGDCMVTN